MSMFSLLLKNCQKYPKIGNKSCKKLEIAKNDAILRPILATFQQHSLKAGSKVLFQHLRTKV